MDGLERFVEAQALSNAYGRALDEMRTGGKRSHWIWYVFPQLAGLGHSATARYYALRDEEEARAYLQHPLLGGRLREITAVVADYPSSLSPVRFMSSSTDALKLCSSMTLFDALSPDDVFAEVLRKFYDGRRDTLTLRLLDTPR